ncbi:hypothetical protein [Streptomyces tauricus]
MQASSAEAALIDSLLTEAGRQAAADPAVRRADFQTATVTAVNLAAGTVDVGAIRARLVQETYRNPTVGDQVVLLQSGIRNWIALGRLSSGTTDTPWTDAVLATGFTHNGNSNGNVQWRQVSIAGTRFMQWRGGLGITYVSNAIQNGGDILTAALPAAYRPAALRSLSAPCSASSSSSFTLKVDARADGLIRIVGTTTSTSDTYGTPIIRPPWVSLNNLQYSLD